jgi:hypothetical protein
LRAVSLAVFGSDRSTPIVVEAKQFSNRRRQLAVSARGTSDLGLPSSEKSEADPALSAAGRILGSSGLVITY